MREDYVITGIDVTDARAQAYADFTNEEEVSLMVKHDLNQALQRMRAKNIPLTPQRHALLAYLYAQEGYVAVKEICEAMVGEYPQLNAMTVTARCTFLKS